MDSRGLIVEVKEEQCKIKSDNEIMATASSRGSLYVLDTPEKMKALKLLALLASTFGMSDLPMWIRKES